MGSAIDGTDREDTVKFTQAAIKVLNVMLLITGRAGSISGLVFRRDCQTRPS